MARNDPTIAILNFIADYTNRFGYAPSYREIGCGVGLKSVSSVHRHVHRMIEAGMLQACNQRPRAVAPMQAPEPEEQAYSHRIRLDLADGGKIYFDLSVERTHAGNLIFCFDGILDATRLKGNVGRIVRYEAERSETG